jgi:fucose permease
VNTKLKRLYLLLILNFLFFGASLTIIGASLPKIIADYQWSYIQTGIVLAAGAVGYFLSTFVSGFLIRRYGLNAVLTGGLAVTSLSCLLFGFLPLFWLNAVFNLMIGAGQGGIEVVVNSSVVRMEREGEQHLMGYVHAAFSGGAVVGPLGVGSLLTSGIGWRGAFIGVGVFFGLLAVSAVFYPFSRIETSNIESKGKRKIENPSVIVLGTAIILTYVGVEVGISNWIGEYSSSSLALSPERASLVVALFWFGMLCGRAIFPLLFKKMNGAVELFLLSLFTTLSAAAIGLVPVTELAVAAVFAAGAGCSSIYPLVMLLVGRKVRGNESVGLGIVATGGGVGGFVFPFIMSAISQAFGIKTGFLFFPAVGIVLSALCFLMILRERGGRHKFS